MNVAIMVSKLKRNLSKKAICCQWGCYALFSWAHSRRSLQGFAVRGILYKSTFVRSPRCSKRRRIDETDISTHVAADQLDANCLEEAVRSFAATQSRYRSPCVDVTFFVYCQFFELIGARRSTVSKLGSQWNCSAAHELLLCERKTLLLEGW